MRLLLAAAVLATGPALAQDVPEGDCARLAEALEEGTLPVPWEDEAGEIAEVAAAGREGACLAMFDLIRPSPPTGPADLPPACIRLRALMAEDGPPAEVRDRTDALVAAIGEGDADACAEGLEVMGVEG